MENQTENATTKKPKFSFNYKNFKNLSLGSKIIHILVPIAILLVVGCIITPTEDPSSTSSNNSTKIVDATSEDMPWFDITSNGEIYLKPEYRGAKVSADYISDNGLNEAGSKFNKLPKTLVIPNTFNGISVVSIHDCAFSDGISNSNIKNVIIGDNVVLIGSFAFNSYLESVTLGKNVQTIGKGAFMSCYFSEIIFPDSLKIIGDMAFSGCTKLKSVTFPNTLEKIGLQAFANCSSLDTIDFVKIEESNLKEISTNAFVNCVKLEEIILPDSLIKIAELAFMNCTALKNVSIGITDNCQLDEVGFKAFSGCTNLNRIEYYNAWAAVTWGEEWCPDESIVECMYRFD